MWVNESHGPPSYPKIIIKKKKKKQYRAQISRDTSHKKRMAMLTKMADSMRLNEVSHYFFLTEITYQGL